MNLWMRFFLWWNADKRCPAYRDYKQCILPRNHGGRHMCGPPWIEVM